MRNWLCYTENWLDFLYSSLIQLCLTHLPSAALRAWLLSGIKQKKEKKKLFIFSLVEVHFNCFGKRLWCVWRSTSSCCRPRGNLHYILYYKSESIYLGYLFQHLQGLGNKEILSKAFLLQYFLPLPSLPPLAPLSLPPTLHHTDKVFGSSWDLFKKKRPYHVTAPASAVFGNWWCPGNMLVLTMLFVKRWDTFAPHI